MPGATPSAAASLPRPFDPRAVLEEDDADDEPAHTNPSASRTAFGSNSSASSASAVAFSFFSDDSRRRARDRVRVRDGGEAGFVSRVWFLGVVCPPPPPSLRLLRGRILVVVISARRLLPVNLGRGARGSTGDLVQRLLRLVPARARAGASQNPPRTNPQNRIRRWRWRRPRPRPRRARSRRSQPPRRSNVPRRAVRHRACGSPVDVFVVVAFVSVSASAMAGSPTELGGVAFRPSRCGGARIRRRRR